MDDFDKLAERIAEKWYDYKVPNCPTVIAEIFLSTITDFPEAPAAVLEMAKRYFVECLSMALADRIKAQDAAEETEFVN